MGLTEKYNNYLQEKKEKVETSDTIQKLPKELQPAIDPIQITPDVREVLNEFISLIPNNLWKKFPDNASTKVYMDKTIDGENSMGWLRCRFHTRAFFWFSQIICNDNQVKLIEIKYKDIITYRNNVYEPYYSDRQRKKLEKVIEKKYSILEVEEKNHFISFRENYCAILMNYIKNLSQEYICLKYDDGLDEDGCYYSQYLVIFKDGNVYNWTTGYPSKKGAHPLKTQETAEAFLLEKLKHQPNSENQADGSFPTIW